MRRLLVLIPILALASASLAGDEAVEAKETLRRRLCDAFRALPRVHVALRWDVSSVDQEPYAFVTEYFQKGDRAGLHIVLSQGDDTVDYATFATDGATLRYEVEGQAQPGTSGVRAMNAYYEPYYEARRRLAARWGVAIHCAVFHLAPHLQIEEREGEPEVFYSLSFTQGEAPAGWLAQTYFEDLEASVLEEQGLVHLRAAHFEGSLRLADGLPVSWSSRNPRTRGVARARAVATQWSEARWNEVIARMCRPAPVQPLPEEEQARANALSQLLRDVLAASPRVLESAPTLDALIAEAIAADLQRKGPATLPAEADEAAREAHVTQRASEVRAAFFDMALESGWSEVAAAALGDRAAQAWRAGFEAAQAR